MRIAWAPVIGGAFLLELVLFAVLVPIQSVSRALFLIAVPIGCFVFGYTVTFVMLRRVSEGLWLNAMLVGVLATALYLAVVISSPGGMRAAIDVYGVPLFVFSNGMRIAGSLAAALHLQRRAEASADTAEHV
jgi:hypothetical protein